MTNSDRFGFAGFILGLAVLMAWVISSQSDNVNQSVSRLTGQVSDVLERQRTQDLNVAYLQGAMSNFDPPPRRSADANDQQTLAPIAPDDAADIVTDIKLEISYLTIV